MDYKAYHQALMLGFSESEATRIGEDAYLDNMRLQNSKDDRVPVPLCDICGAADAVVKTTNNYYVCSECGRQEESGHDKKRPRYFPGCDENDEEDD